MIHILHLITAVLISITLLYIDESAFSINFETGTLVFFAIFTIFFFSGQYVVHHVLAGYKDIYRSWHSVVAGLPLGLLMYYASLIIFSLTKKYVG